MIRTIVFDLSEVLIAGLLGIEKPLSEQLQVPDDKILAAFGGRLLEELCRGRISEDSYLAQIVEEQRWTISVDTVKRVIRQNLCHRVPGMVELLYSLEKEYDLVLISDHAVEWIEYVRGVHPFLTMFSTQVYSFETGLLKSEPLTFQLLLETIDREPEECVFVDDNPGNVRTAGTVGIVSIRFRDAARLVTALSACGVSV